MNWAPHAVTLRQLQYAVAVADTLSFRLAAERCRVAQPSLSAQLSQLEDALGVKLFERGRRGVLATPAGAELIERARRLLLDADDLAEVARRAADPLNGMLRIGVLPTISPYLLPAVTRGLRKEHPRLTVRWLEDKTPALVRALGSGELDAALVALESELGRVESETIAIDPFDLAVARGHKLADAKTPLSAARLRGAPLLLLEEGHCFREQALAFCSRARVRELEFRATSMATLAQMAASGAGATLLPRLSIPTEARRFDLHLRPLAAPAPKRTIALVWRERSPLASALRKLAATLRAAYPGSHP